MRALDYAIREGWASLWRSRGSAAFAVLAIALAMIVLGALLLTTWNVERLLAQWSSAAEFSVYLRDDASSEQRGAIEAIVDQSGVIAGRQYISKAEALARFRREFADLASLTNDFEDNPFPASVEVQVRPDAQDDGRADAVVKRVAGLPGVADVRYDRQWLARLASGLADDQGCRIRAGGRHGAGCGRHRGERRQAGSERAPLASWKSCSSWGPRSPSFAVHSSRKASSRAASAPLVALAALWLGLGVAGGWWGRELSLFLDGRIPPIPAAPAVRGAGGRGDGGGWSGGLAASRHAV